MKLILALLTLILFSCKKETPQPSGWCAPAERIGCVCNDGTFFVYPAGTPYNNQCAGHSGFKNYMCN